MAIDPRLRKTALILLVDPDVVDISCKVIERMGHRCILAKDRAEGAAILEKEIVDLLICTIHDKNDDFAFFDMAKKMAPQCPGIAIFDSALEEHFPELLVRGYPRNLIADNHPPDFLELTATIQKLLNGDLFGMEKYGIPVHETVEVNSSGQKYALVERVRDFYLEKGIQDRIIRNVELILNELLMNAIFDAPVDDKGQHIYLHLDRSSNFDLNPHERPELQYGISQNRIAVSVSDPFGMFRENTFFSYVHRCFTEKKIVQDDKKTAGMGLFLVFKSLNQLVINVAFHKKTEVIALIECQPSVRHLKKHRRSFHHFHIGEY